jgi:hypothetical protein
VACYRHGIGSPPSPYESYGKCGGFLLGEEESWNLQGFARSGSSCVFRESCLRGTGLLRFDERRQLSRASDTKGWIQAWQRDALARRRHAARIAFFTRISSARCPTPVPAPPSVPTIQTGCAPRASFDSRFEPSGGCRSRGPSRRRANRSRSTPERISCNHVHPADRRVRRRRPAHDSDRVAGQPARRRRGSALIA